ncbi:MAG: hypothetical protein V2I33_20815 [Kangiellaceae bacterium]|jgi:hypothetical protein|nr:hypothetical protein [Kangiellaceae bacterium]
MGQEIVMEFELDTMDLFVGLLISKVCPDMSGRSKRIILDFRGNCVDSVSQTLTLMSGGTEIGHDSLTNPPFLM